jgi:hypothetical protein
MSRVAKLQDSRLVGVAAAPTKVTCRRWQDQLRSLIERPVALNLCALRVEQHRKRDHMKRGPIT